MFYIQLLCTDSCFFKIVYRPDLTYKVFMPLSPTVVVSRDLYRRVRTVPGRISSLLY